MTAKKTTTLAPDVESIKKADDKELIVGSRCLVKTLNKATKKEYWSLVLSLSNDFLTCVKLTSNAAFGSIPEIQIFSQEVFGPLQPVYANVFSGIFQCPIDAVVDTTDQITDQEYVGIVSTLTNVFMGFWYQDPESKSYVIDVPYVRNPVYYLGFGMASISDAKQISANMKVNLAKRKEKKEAEARENRMKNAPKLKQSSKNAIDILNGQGVYTMETEDRINMIYHVFSPFLTEGNELNIRMAHKAIFQGATPNKSRRSNFSISKAEFALVLNSDIASVRERYHCPDAAASAFRKQVKEIYNGKISQSYRRNSAELVEFVTKLYNEDKLSIDAIAEQLTKRYDGMDLFKAISKVKGIVQNHISQRKPKIQKDTVSVSDKCNAIMETAWLKSFKRLDEVKAIVEHETPYIDMIIDGSRKIEHDDPLVSMLAQYCIFRSYTRRAWFKFMELDHNKGIVEFLNSFTIREIFNEYFSYDGMISTTPVFQAKGLAYCMSLSDNDKENIRRANSIGKLSDAIDPIMITMVNQAATFSQTLITECCREIGIEPANLIEAAHNVKYGK